MSIDGNKTNKRAVCILGMHRSGTSAITRIFNLLGVYLGKEEDLLPANDGNPEGYWEHARIVEVHDELLKALGGRWAITIPLPHEWWKTSEVAPFRNKLKKIILDEFSGSELWGWKDPRTCILLPLWIDILKELGVDLSFVVILRNPLEVADSLTRRDGFSTDKGLALWFLYMLNAIRWSQSFNRAFISYDNFLEDWESEVYPAAAKLSVNRLKDDDALIQKVSRSIKPQLRHHSRNIEETLALLPGPIAKLYELCLEKDENKLSLDKGIEKLFEAYDILDQVKVGAGEQALYLEIEQKNQEIEQKNQELEQKNQEIEQKNHMLNDALSQLTSIQSSLMFKLMARYARCRNSLLPEGTQRNRLYKLFTRSGHIALDEGCPSLLQRGWRYLRKGSPKNMSS